MHTVVRVLDISWHWTQFLSEVPPAWSICFSIYVADRRRTVHRTFTAFVFNISAFFPDCYTRSKFGNQRERPWARRNSHNLWKNEGWRLDCKHWCSVTYVGSTLHYCTALELDLMMQDGEASKGGKGGEEGGGGGQHPDGITVNMAGKTIALSLFPRLMSILTVTDDLNPHLRSIGWLLKRTDELYDARQG